MIIAIVVVPNTDGVVLARGARACEGVAVTVAATRALAVHERRRVSDDAKAAAVAIGDIARV